jgi:hypothetical protein
MENANLDAQAQTQTMYNVSEILTSSHVTFKEVQLAEKEAPSLAAAASKQTGFAIPARTWMSADAQGLRTMFSKHIHRQKQFTPEELMKVLQVRVEPELLLAPSISSQAPK